MSTKRKASVFEEDMFYLQPNTPPVTSSPLSSTSSSSTISSENNNNTAYDCLRVKAVPYLNSRTRKRYRDDKPNEEVIHENTLRKLYDAQRLHLDEAMPMSDVISLDQDGLPMYNEADDTEMMTDDVLPPEAEIPQTAQPNQTTIDAFFGGRGGGLQQSRANAVHLSPPPYNPFLSTSGDASNRPPLQIQRTCFDYWNNPNLRSVNDSAAAR
ncbi:uncharacterized protein Z520_08323 [Fonsecaea multimorphosa CBS 102226]|uniref:Uncharacterized protein n=1 Tax=Fonsecaea multimorphosa CBS 102226 TaxID=1442371 RepID=A0A0D2KHC2_9EURO|nr:uncharacterized protein Z520_08323 [Fonsecaea multimorphosa CBS 102226]KIX96068.1 hypothetical protein Z520_08323 [Fonsecaea multimorphosa CBS 102226]OAL21834.1 hypothetical protein AYO22_07776 [Fonsecaea multimorphosa]